MDGFAAEYLANLTADLTVRVVEATHRRMREALSGTEGEQAMRRCIQAGLVALLAKATVDAPEDAMLLQDIFTDFFKDPLVALEISKLLRGRSLDREGLAELFEQAGYDARTLPGLEFGAGLAAFEAAFAEAAVAEPALRGLIQTDHLMEQTRLQGALLAEVRELVSLLREARPGSVGVQAGQITAENVVSGMQIVYRFGGAVSPPEVGEGAPLRRDYLNHLFETVGRLSLSGIDPKAVTDTEARLNLSAVYTALLTLTPEEYERMRDKGCLEPAVERERERLSALAQLDRHPRLVLLGDPGSGKSTFVNFVALCLAGEALGQEGANLALLTEPLPLDEGDRQRSDEPQPQPWSHGVPLPVRVVLRDFAARGLPSAGEPTTAQHLWDFVAAELEAAALGDYALRMRQELHKQGGLLLLDGLDEVPQAENRRAQIKQAVEDFAAAFPRCRIVVTSRTYAYQQQAWRLPDFTEAILAPFGSGQIRRFVDRWYAHIAPIRGLNANDAQGRAELLKQAIFGSDRLRALAERPLLLTLMASLHAWRGGTLPEKREQLYADTVDLLLDWWESPKVVRDADGEVIVQQPSLAEWLQVNRTKVRELLNELAYRAHADQPDPAGTADVPESRLVDRLMDLSQNPDVRPKRLIEYLSQRAGLLLPRGVGVYAFPHRTFQEYLAACYFTEQADYPTSLAMLAREDPNRWREVVLLAGAKAARGMAASIWLLLDELCPRALQRGAPQKEADAWGALMAGQALVETADLKHLREANREKVKRVRGRLVGILEAGHLPAVERAAAGRALAKLGDPRPGVSVDPATGLPDILWCYVPPGPFLMGSADDDEMAYDDEKPRHPNDSITEGYLISRYPVTNAQFGVFMEAGGYQERGYWTEAERAKVWAGGKIEALQDDQPREGPYDYGEPFNLPSHPVVGVTWYEAVAYCRWLGERLQVSGFKFQVWRDGQPETLSLEPKTLTVRLPSEAEWEKAARGTDGWRYSWGDDPDPDRANYDQTGIGTTSAVGCFPGGVSPYRVEDLSGNVWEWCATKWEGSYEGYRGDNDPEGDDVRVLRGGAFSDEARYVRCASRLRLNPSYRYRYYGFRVVASPVHL